MKALALFLLASATSFGKVSPLYLDPTFNVSRAITGTETAIVPLLQVGEGTFDDPDTFHVFGSQRISHTAQENDDHALEIDVDDAGFSDVKAIDIDYITGDIEAGEDEAVILINVDEVQSTGGRVTGMEVLSTDAGGSKKEALFVGVGISPIEHLSGTFEDAGSISDNGTDVLTALSDGGVGNITLFENDNETLTIGKSSRFEEIEVILDIGSSGAGISPTFEYSTGVDTWATFGPVDGTNQFKNTGIIAWEDSDIPSWAAGTGSEFLIRITRTRNSLTTSPRADLIQVSSATEYYWDKDGQVLISRMYVSGDISGTADMNINSGTLVVDSASGNVGIGTSSPAAKLHVSGSVSITNSLDVTGTINVYGDIISYASSMDLISETSSTNTRKYSYRDSTTHNLWTSFASRGSVSSQTILSDGDDGFNFRSRGWDGNSWEEFATIKASVDGTPGDEDMPGRLVFSTSPDGSGAVIERMRINNAGNVGIGVTNPTDALSVSGSISASVDIFAGDDIVAIDNIATNDGNIGVGITVPTERIQAFTATGDIKIKVESNSGEAQLTLDSGGASGVGKMQFLDDGGSGWEIKHTNSGNLLQVYDELGTAEVMTFESGGNVGIGTASPENKLDIEVTNSATEIALSVNNTTNRFLKIGVEGNDVSKIAFDNADDLAFGTLATHATAFSSFVPLMTIDGNTGNVGIGATSPSSPLAVVDATIDFTASFTSSDNKSGITIADNDTSGRIIAEGGVIQIGLQNTQSVDNLTIDGSGNVGIGVIAPGSPFTVIDPTIDFTASFTSSDNKSGITIADNDTNGRIIVQDSTIQIGLQDTQSVDNLTVDGSGNVGIGTIAPGADLEVSGTVSATEVVAGGTVNAPYDSSAFFTNLAEDPSVTVLLNAPGTGNDTGFHLRSENVDWYMGVDRSAQNMVFVRETNQMMVIDSSGNVGIGTTDPDDELHIRDFTPAIIFEDETVGGDDFRIRADGNDIEWAVDTNDDGTFDNEVQFDISSTALRLDSDFEISNLIPLLKFEDTSTSADDFWFIANSNKLQLELDTNDDDTSDLTVMYVDAGGDVGFKTSNPVHEVDVTGTAGLSTGTLWTNTSDERLKDIHGPYEKGLAEVIQLQPIWFNYKKDNPVGIPSDFERTGFSAQEVKKIYPEAINEREDGYLELNADPLYMSLFNAIKELNEKVERLEQQCGN
jgi:hypothetical protein